MLGLQKGVVYVNKIRYLGGSDKMQQVRWINSGDFWECENCKLGWFFTDGTPEDNEFVFCPKCGCEVAEFVHEEVE